MMQAGTPPLRAESVQHVGRSKAAPWNPGHQFAALAHWSGSSLPSCTRRVRFPQAAPLFRRRQGASPPSPSLIPLARPQGTRWLSHSPAMRGFFIAHDRLLQRNRPVRGAVAAEPHKRWAYSAWHRGRKEHRGCLPQRFTRLHPVPFLRRDRGLVTFPPVCRMERRPTCLDWFLPVPTFQRGRQRSWV